MKKPIDELIEEMFAVLDRIKAKHSSPSTDFRITVERDSDGEPHILFDSWTAATLTRTAERTCEALVERLLTFDETDERRRALQLEIESKSNELAKAQSQLAALEKEGQ